MKSNTVVGDLKHSPGVVLAEIVRANIPVKNGVVHLIHRPLMVVDTTVKQFLEVSSTFLEHILDSTSTHIDLSYEKHNLGRNVSF